MGRSVGRARFVWLALLVVAAALPGAAMAQEAAPSGEDRSSFGSQIRDLKKETIPGRIIVRYDEQSGQAAQAAARREVGAVKKGDLDLINADVVKVESGTVASAVEDLEANPVVEYAVPDRVVYPMDYRDEPRFSELWGLHNTGQEVLGRAGKPDVDVDAPEAAATSSGGQDVVVAVIDDGVDFGHPDLAGHEWVNEDEVPNNNIDDDANGYVDDVNGFDFANDDNTVHDTLEDFHGTHVAGTIAASVNGQDVVGVAPNVKIMSLKFLGGPFGSLSTAIEAIQYAGDNGARISNNSWGYVGPPDPALKDAIEASGMLFVASAGNEALNNDTGFPIPELGFTVRAYPASYDLPNVLSVAAVNNTGRLASFSNFGAKTVDVSAPGVDVLSTVPSVPQKSGLTLSAVGSGEALVAGFGLEEISGADARADFAEKALDTLGYCTGLGGVACPTSMNKVLLVDDDLSSTFPPALAEFGPPDVRPVVAAALNSVQNVDLDVVNVGVGDGPSFEKLSQYDHVVWATGQAPVSTDPFDETAPVRNTLTFNDHNALTRYLNGGGGLFLTGLDTFYLDEKAAFVTETLGLEVQGDYYTGVFEGAAGTPFGGNTHDLNNAPFSVPFFHDGLTPAKPNASSLGTIGTPQGYEEYFSGTSMASPHATGTAALAAGEFSGLLNRPAALKRLVMGTGQPAPLTQGKTVTGDIVNARNAVTDTRPRIPAVFPKGAISDTTPTIRARVVDLQQMLPKSNVELYVDGNRKMTFSYNRFSGVLSHAAGPLKEGRHFVRIKATDPQGATTSRSWSFTVR
ncbi:S8 family serine peptidase [Rubrobacter tropicus]|uniref:S8 family serine peptidase n=1 Tax=Rubrobacter tropicus TaxID=2653851 RepID=A0A6G8Q677_9ACTN|nr:S8 family peptidase [Rubrobacter tropicus]QIN81985.1 S8 family serine peptidase [Rubrobacter tropicus]